MAALTFKNGKMEILEPREYSYKFTKDFFDGEIFAGHLISREPYIYIFCDDEGLIKKMTPNFEFLEYLADRRIIYGYPIVGPIICFESEWDALVYDGQVKTGK